MIHPSTFSIVAYDPDLSAWGIAVASKFPAAGAVVPWARAGAGAVATQSHANTTYGPVGLALMEEGLSASQALDRLTDQDDQAALRQVGLVDAQGQPATFTGEDCLEWAGGLTGPGFTVQGNILTGPEVLESMVAEYEGHNGDFPSRLVASILAGDRSGGDRRGRQSAALLVVRESAGYAGFNDRWLDYRVDDHPDPIPKLQELVEMHQLYFGESAEGDQLELAGSVLEALQTIMIEQGYYSGPVHGELDQPTRQSLRAFVGNENFEERTDLERGTIDRPVFSWLVDRFE